MTKRGIAQSAKRVLTAASAAGLATSALRLLLVRLPAAWALATMYVGLTVFCTGAYAVQSVVGPHGERQWMKVAIVGGGVVMFAGVTAACLLEAL